MHRRLRDGFEVEMSRAAAALGDSDLDTAFRHYERAHVLSQAYAGPHVRVHAGMLRVGWRRRALGELLGQLIRVLAAGPASFIGHYPRGNTGGTNVHPLRSMPIPPDLEALLDEGG
jgi:hypothetical protein